MQHNFTAGLRRFLIRHAGWMLFLPGCCLVSCHSSRHTRVAENTNIQSAQESKSGSVAHYTGEKSGSESVEKVRTETDEYFKVSYGDDGKIRDIQGYRRNVGVREVGRLVFRAADDSIKINLTDSAKKASSIIDRKTEETKSADSRPVQGIDWLWIVLGIGAVAAGGIGLYYLKRKFF